MAAHKLLDAYFDAFNAHDADAVAALFGARGTYRDPATAAGVKGKAFREYLRAHYASFPDARYKLLRIVSGRGGLLACEWRFRGTNSGSMGEAPATNRAVDLPGASMLQAKDGRIAWLHGYYDRRNLLRQLGR